MAVSAGDPARRGGRPSVYERRRERMDALVWELVRDELRDGQPGPNDLATRAVLADALAESGNLRLAQALARWPARKKLWRTPLHRKIEAAVRGPVQRSTLDRTPPKKLLLARVGGNNQQNPSRWIRVDRNVGGPHDGKPFVVEMGMGYSSYYALVWAFDMHSAYEIAQETFPFHFYEEIDEDELEEDGPFAIPHPTKPNVYLIEDEGASAAIHRAHQVVSARRLDRYGRQARLRTGETVEFIE